MFYKSIKYFFAFSIFMTIMQSGHSEQPPRENVLRSFADIKPRHQRFQEEMEKQTRPKTSYVCVDYDEEGAYCGCVLANGAKPTNFLFPIVDIECSATFYKYASMAVCGNVWYEQMKHCALVSFFNDNPLPQSNVAEKHKRTLIILDACVTSTTKCKITGLRVTHHEKGGNIFSTCSDEPDHEAFSVSDLAIVVPAGEKVDAESAAFTLPVVLHHRICGQIFSNTEPDEEYTKLKLHVKYSCGDSETTKELEVILPDINLNDEIFKERVGELRGIWINLDKKETKKFVRKDLNYKVEEGPKKWENARVDCWTQNKTCELLA